MLYSTVQAYAAATGWKPTLSRSIYIRCSCYNRPTRNRSEKERKYASGPLCKDCNWEIKIRSTVNDMKKINTGLSKGKYKSYPVVKDGVNVIISKANIQHSGECIPSKLQQVMQRSRSGAYIKNISDISLYTLCMILKDEGKVPSTIVKQILSTQFPANKNVTNRHVYWMKNRLKTLLPRMNVKHFKTSNIYIIHPNYIQELMAYHYQMTILHKWENIYGWK